MSKNETRRIKCRSTPWRFLNCHNPPVNFYPLSPLPSFSFPPFSQGKKSKIKCRVPAFSLRHLPFPLRLCVRKPLKSTFLSQERRKDFIGIDHQYEAARHRVCHVKSVLDIFIRNSLWRVGYSFFCISVVVLDLSFLRGM